MLLNSNTRYGFVSQLFHWMIVGLIVLQFVLATLASNASMFRQLVLLGRHKSFGILILGLAILRLVWRWINAPPPPLPQHHSWQRHAANLIHAALYTLLFAQPITGWMMSSARGFSVSFFGLFTLPDLVSASDEAYAFYHSIHQILAVVLVVLVFIHITAALIHHFLWRDDTLRRMLPVVSDQDQDAAKGATSER